MLIPTIVAKPFNEKKKRKITARIEFCECNETANELIPAVSVCVVTVDCPAHVRNTVVTLISGMLNILVELRV